VPRVTLAPGYSISRLITGCWQLAEGHGGHRCSESEILRRMATGVGAGFTTFDCADIYTGVEQLLGRFIARPGLRAQVQVHTKYVPDRAALPELRARDVERAIDRSLRRLGVERLDLVQFHWWDYTVPRYLDVLHALGRLRDAGKIRHLGLTNFDTSVMAELLATDVPLVSIQLQYSLLDRRPERFMAAACQREGISMLPYGVLAGGLLSERFLSGERPDATNRSQVKYALVADEAGGWSSVQGLLACLGAVAARHGVDIATVAAAWVLARPGVAAVILGFSHRERFREQLAIPRLQMTRRDRVEIDTALAALQVPEGDVYGLERVPDGPHARIMKTDLNAASRGPGEASE
jgi:aryl-alcohol dehydrogenase-like predicted oxidoreductase